MPWVVDGNNLAGGSDRERVRRAILNLARREKLRVVVFFDGAPPAGAPWVEKLGAVEVRYVPHADAAILAFLRGSGRGWRLVSSDQALVSRARGLGADVVSVADFRRKLERGDETVDGQRANPAAGADYRAGVTPLPPEPLRVRRRRAKGF